MDAARELIAALGGSANILDVEPCAMRIRVEVDSQADVREPGLRIPGVLGVVRSGSFVQIIAGLDSEPLADSMRDLLVAERTAGASLVDSADAYDEP
ncbi:PTS transporter subunit EIIB [Actinomyces sp. B33]|uniref:PTS transporter subunit EIIB n=1 Tax=Actinomyces sp. B33 TaxID=2942131 RepID=UPI002342095C|nr:PTS transporter subunit EIIB [Actinomyces sp. B33]MDC4232910.1 PTS transporter subunit EIIB [Actinomyces sp. B33]